MGTMKPRRSAADVLAAWAWAALAVTPVGWFYGALAIAYSHLGDVTDVNKMIGGIVLFVTAPASAFILAVYAARAGHRSGKIAVVVSGLLLLATLAALTWGTQVDRPGRHRGRRDAGSRLGVLPQNRRGGVRAAAPGHTSFLRVGERRVDPSSRDRRDGGGRGAGLRLGPLPQQAAARAGRRAARGGTACGSCAARRIWTDFVSSPSLAPSSLTRHVPPARPGISAPDPG